MKIQCDVCHKEEASVFCSSDEAALCHACDNHIHHINKLARKHTRFSLHNTISKHTPICDICQEMHAYVFCREDRAIICTKCDLSIHEVNEHTQKHNRFFLTGVKLGASSTDSTSSLCSNDTASASEIRTSSSKTNNISSETGSVSTSSISEYLTETIPGYCMEDLLDASFAPNGFYNI
ncbi:PREDICTED: B-box zinc finger protein 20-like [Lupinus angustifolius]|uniref:B-box zinc finger protein 20-like n=1 Tax=Lupinus angustifolius TaxID=3871 RepID=UPI00092E2BEB|nr:PREDICTED: B-box zinc finger protein 20-like [Lupinus angustifolius]